LGAPYSVEGATPAAETKLGRCPVNERIGDLVVVPVEADDAAFGVLVIHGVDKPAAQCQPPNYAGCIVARRALGFIEHASLNMPIALRLSCRDVPCKETTTCVDGDCVLAEIDPNACLSSPGCDESVLTSGSGGAGSGGAGGAGGAGSGGGNAMCPATPAQAAVCDNAGLMCNYGSLCCQCKTMTCGERWQCEDSAPLQGCPPAVPPAGMVQCLQGGTCSYCDQGVPRKFFCNGNDTWEEQTDVTCP